MCGTPPTRSGAWSARTADAGGSSIVPTHGVARPHHHEHVHGHVLQQQLLALRLVRLPFWPPSLRGTQSVAGVTTLTAEHVHYRHVIGRCVDDTPVSGTHATSPSHHRLLWTPPPVVASCGGAVWQGDHRQGPPMRWAPASRLSHHVTSPSVLRAAGLGEVQREVDAVTKLMVGVCGCDFGDVHSPVKHGVETWRRLLLYCLHVRSATCLSRGESVAWQVQP